jgi:hypothetical protein
MQDDEFCFWHSPQHAQDAAEARRLGGLNRKREITLSSVYEVEGLETASQIRRVLEIALAGELSLENSHNRSRVLIAVATAAARLLEAGELEARVDALETTLTPRLAKPEPPQKRNWWSR